MKSRRARKPQAGLFENLAKMIQQASRGNFFDDELGVEAPGAEAYTVGEWIEGLRTLKEMHAPSIEKRAQKLSCTFQVSQLDPTGYVAADCDTPDGRYEVFLSLDLVDFGMGGGCSCDFSRDEQPCEHTYRFAKYLLTELNDRSSSLRARITGDLPASSQPPQPAYTPAILDQLDRYLASRPTPQDEDANEDRSQEVRLLWKLESDRGSLELVPFKQRPKKRGSGWTKGQRISLDKLHHSRDLIRSTVDRNVVATLHLQSGYNYYRPEFSFDMVEALSELAGHDLVMCDEKPVEVRRFAFGIRVVQQDAGFALEIAFPGERGEGFGVSLYSNGIVARSNTRPLVLVCHCDAAQTELAQSLIREVLLPRERLQDLRQRLAQINQATPVQLPESLAGPIVPQQTTPVVLLRSRQEGQLECGMRVKDAQSRMFLPGEGALLYADKCDDKPVQYRRDPHEETVRARRIERDLQLDRAHALSPWNWRILDFDQSLQLLEDLENRGRELGFETVWDPKSVQPIRILGSVTARNVRVEVSKSRDWFGLGGGCKIGQHEFQLADLLNNVRSEPAAGYMEIQPGQWARISAELREKLQQFRDVAHKNRKKFQISETAAPVIQDLLEAQIDIEAPKSWRDCLSRLEKARQLEPALPASFRGTLRDYQLEGYRWLRRLAEWGVGGCLADDMGLGKTVQALAVLIDRQPTGPALVIAPTSVGFNWVRETERFAPDLKPHLYRETDRAGFLEHVRAGDVVICSYGLALRDAAALGKVQWGTLILDEAQFVKNSRSKTSQAIRTFTADWKLAMTGTPMENHLGELWSIFRNVSPGLFGSWDDFRDRFAAPIEKRNDDDRREALSRLIRPFVLRRAKSEVLQELPERTETNLYIELNDEERRRYDEMRLAAIGEIDEIVGLPESKDQRFRILALLTRLRQLACHVGLVDQAWKGSSAKLELLVETLQELREEGHRALVFSQFTSYLAFIRQALDAAGITYQYLDGSTPAKARQQRVDAFQAGESDAFLISLKAGGTGLNLTGADYVIHMDPWWNPAVEDQATDRAHRIGQTRPVMVYRIVAGGTIEEQILDLHRDKRDLVAGVMEGTHSAGRLATDQLIELIRGAAP